MCQPELSETVELVEACEDVLTDDCQDDPLDQPWTKRCDTETLNNAAIKFSFSEDNSDPQTNVVHESSTELSTLTQTTTEDVSDIIDLINDRITAESRAPRGKLYFSSTSTTTASTATENAEYSSIYFDPVLNTRALDQRTSKSSYTQDLNHQMETQFNEETLSTSTTTTEAPFLKMMKSLSPAELLQLCFVHQRGCDLSQNQVETKSSLRLLSTLATTTTTTTTAAIVSTKSPIKSKVLSTKQEKLRDRLKKCFTQGICSDAAEEKLESFKSSDDILEESFVSVTTPRIITTTQSYRRSEILRKIKEKARACFYDGKCN